MVEATTTSIRAKILIGVLGLALLSFVASQWFSKRYAWAPVELPLNLESGWEAEAAFKSDYGGAHEVEVETATGPEHDRYNRLMGIDPRSIGSPPAEGGLSIEWTLASEGKAIKEGRSDDWRGARWAQRSAKILCSFTAEKGLEYSVRLRATDSSIELQGLDPKLLVRLDPDVRRSHQSIAAVLGMASLVSLAAAVLTIVALSLVNAREGDALPSP